MRMLLSPPDKPRQDHENPDRQNENPKFPNPLAISSRLLGCHGAVEPMRKED